MKSIEMVNRCEGGWRHGRSPDADGRAAERFCRSYAAKGKARDGLYLKQQKMAHAEALSLMQTYASSGTAMHLKDAAGEIQPVVQGHVDMLDKMAM